MVLKIMCLQENVMDRQTATQTRLYWYVPSTPLKLTSLKKELQLLMSNSLMPQHMQKKMVPDKESDKQPKE